MALAAPVSDAGLALAAVMQQLGLNNDGPLSDELLQHAVEACRVAGNRAFRAKDYKGGAAGHMARLARWRRPEGRRPAEVQGAGTSGSKRRCQFSCTHVRQSLHPSPAPQLQRR